MEKRRLENERELLRNVLLAALFYTNERVHSGGATVADVRKELTATIDSLFDGSFSREIEKVAARYFAPSAQAE